MAEPTQAQQPTTGPNLSDQAASVANPSHQPGLQANPSDQAAVTSNRQDGYGDSQGMPQELPESLLPVMPACSVSRAFFSFSSPSFSLHLFLSEKQTVHVGCAAMFWAPNCKVLSMQLLLRCCCHRHTDYCNEIWW